MKAYRYNALNRHDRQFNTTGREKNPNQMRFYAKSLEYADKYRVIYNDQGEELYQCELEIVELSNALNLFDMEKHYITLDTYRLYIDAQIGKQRKDYTEYLNKAKTKSDRTLWADQLSQLDNREAELLSTLQMMHFQQLSDFEWQNILIAELKSLRFDGYHTHKEIALI